MMRQLAWKECREGGQIWVALAFLGILALCLAPVLHEPDLEARRDFLAVALLILSVAYGVTAGALLLAGEREGGTLRLLDHLIPRRRAVWERKLRIGAALALAQGLFMTALLWGFDLWTGSRLAEETPLLPLVCLEGFIWGLLGSALCPTVLSAAGVAGLIGCIAWMLVAAIGSVFGGPGAAVVRVGLDVGMLAGSASVFCRPDQKRALPGPEARRPPRLGAVGATAWLSWRQARLEWLSLAGLALVAGQLLGADLPLAWPWLMLLVGILFGTRIWSEEQTEGSRRLLADCGLPLGTVWLVKTGVALLALLVVAGLLFTSAAFMCGVRHYAAGHHDWNPFQDLILLDSPAVISYPALVVLSPAVGFAVGQLCGLLCRKRFIAVALAGALGVVLSFPWLPSLAAGLGLWPVLVGPALLLLTCRLILPAWCAERRLLLLAEAGIAVTVGWMAACLAWRALGVRDVGVPLDVPEYLAGLDKLLERESAQVIRHALVNFADRRDEIGPPRLSPRLEGIWAAGGFSHVNRLGWEKAPAEVGIWLDKLFDSAWPAQLHRGVNLPPGVVEDPRWQQTGPFRLAHAASAAGQLLPPRALQLQARGQEEAALTCLLDSFNLSRQMRHGTSLRSYGTWREFETATGMATWASGSKSLALLRQALQAVERQETELLPVRDNIRAAFVSLPSWKHELLPRHSWVRGGRGGASIDLTPFRRGLTDLLILSQELPWERERSERLIRYQFARALGAVPDDPRLDAQSETSFQASNVRALILSSASTRGTVELRLRMLRLQIALILYQREKGRPAQSLTDLTPDYLAELPTDVPTGAPFVYRRATRAETDEIVPGRYVLESRSGHLGSIVVPPLR